MENSHENRMKAIEDFFDNISAEEFEKMIIEAGAGRIVASCESDYVVASNCYDYNYSNLYSSQNKKTLMEYAFDDKGYDNLRGIA